MAGVPLLFEEMARLPEFAAADLSSLELVTIAGDASGAGHPLVAGQGRAATPGLRHHRAGGDLLTQPYGSGRGPAAVDGGHRVHQAPGRPAGWHGLRRGGAGRDLVSGPASRPATGATRRPTPRPCATAGSTAATSASRTPTVLRVVHRLKDIIITGGYNVAPSEIEAVISELPQVAEVCVISAPDAKFGEVPAAVICADGALTAEAVIAFCRERRPATRCPGT